MKFNIKSKKGFTLIELLVVIGILAVLAAIAIPSVAGLIDRANVSADNTNADEMTNAMERFVSEYEIYCQDIANGTLDVNNMDAAQGRVYNVTGADSIEDIRALESESGFNGIRIDLDNKYAQNHATVKAVIENYMKTSSSTFEPKQSDMSYWYNQITGYTVVAETDIEYDKLFEKLPSDIIYSNSQIPFSSEWINLSADSEPVCAEILYSYNKKSSNGWYTYVYVRVPKGTPQTNKIGALLLDENKYNSVDGFYVENIPSNQKVMINNTTWFPKVTSTNKYDIYRFSFLNSEDRNMPMYMRVFSSYTIDGIERYSYSGVYKFIPASLSTVSDYNFDKMR